MRLLFLISFFSLFHTSLAAQWFMGYTADVGVAVRITTMEIKLQSNDQLLGKMESSSGLSPYVTFSSPYTYIKNSSFAYAFQYGFNWITLTRQKSGNESLDLDTRVGAWSIWATPVLVYTIGDHYFIKQSGRAFHIGLGVGVGYLNASGNAVFTELTDQPVHNFSIQSFAYAVHFLADLQINQWKLRFMMEGPSLDQDSWKYSMYDTALILSYSYTLGEFTAEDARRKKMKTDSSWKVNLNTFAGARRIPIIGHSLVSDNLGIGGGVQLDFKKVYWPLSVFAELGWFHAENVLAKTELFSKGEVSSLEFSGQLAALALGFRNIWDKYKAFQPFWGGGVTGLWTEVKKMDAGITENASTYGHGYWVSAGFYVKILQYWNLGFEARALLESVNLFGIEDYDSRGQFQLMLGREF